jgi:hypothetical protein
VISGATLYRVMGAYGASPGICWTVCNHALFSCPILGSTLWVSGNRQHLTHVGRRRFQTHLTPIVVSARLGLTR